MTGGREERGENGGGPLGKEAGPGQSFWGKRLEMRSAGNEKKGQEKFRHACWFLNITNLATLYTLWGPRLAFAVIWNEVAFSLKKKKCYAELASPPTLLAVI